MHQYLKIWPSHKKLYNSFPCFKEAITSPIQVSLMKTYTSNHKFIIRLQHKILTVLYNNLEPNMLPFYTHQ